MSAQNLKFSKVRTEEANEENTCAVSSFEKLLEKVVPDGRYQWTLLLVFLIPLSFFFSTAGFNFVLLLSTPEHHCYVPGRNETNFTTEEWNNLTIPWEIRSDGHSHLSQCKMYNYSQEFSSYFAVIEHNFTIADCQHGWEYDKSTWIETPVTKFNWVCAKKSYVTAIFFSNLAGMAIGTLILSIMSDRFGRKSTFYIALLLNLIFGNALLFATSYTSFIILKFLSATAFISLFNFAYIIVIEICNQRLRSIATLSTFGILFIGTGFVSLAGWLLKEWKLFLLVTQLPLAIFILYWRFIPESPRWLLSKGKLNEFVSVMAKIARTNGVVFNEEVHHLVEKANEEGRKKVSATKLFTSFTLTKHLFLAAFVQCSAILCSFFLNLNVHNMKGNILLNYFLVRSFEFPGDIFGAFTTYFVGRRINGVINMALASISMITASFWVSEAWPLIILCGVTKIFLRAVIYSGYIHTGELFPTPLRSTAYGFVGIVSLSATVISPSLISLGDSNARIPYYIICGICIAGASVASFLPETMGNPLPQTMKEAKQIGKGLSYFSFNPKGALANKTFTDKRLTRVIEEEIMGSSISLS